LGQIHIESFNYFLTDGLKQVINSLDPHEFELTNGEKLKVFVEEVNITQPKVGSQIDVKERRIFPAESRQRHVTYAGNCSMTLGWYKNGNKQPSLDFDLGQIPLMIRVSINAIV
jgi:DNA-directed RNA polymerase I subunit RPA2